MLERSYQTRQGTIRYWVSAPGPRGTALVFLPGLTADHRLFQMQFSFFASHRPLLVWDAPGHGASRPFALDFSLMEQAEWLHGILVRERRACIDRSVHGRVSGAVLYGAIPRTGPGIYLH